MRYWDSSALVSLLVAEKNSAHAAELLDPDPMIATWWGTEVECVSAIGRLERMVTVKLD